jgi:pre-mRNA-processing factor 39
MEPPPAATAAFHEAFARINPAAPDWDEFTKKGGVLSLADAAAAAGDVGPSRAAYAALLARFPLCYGFWKKWALQEWAQSQPLADGRVPQPDRAAALAASARVWEAGAAAVTHSAEHWVNYCDFLGTQCGVEDPGRVRAALLRGVACSTLDPKAAALWDALLRLEAGQGAALGALFARVLGAGAPYAGALWAKLKALAATQPPLQLLGEGEAAGDAALAALAAAAAAQPASEAAAQALRSAILARREAAVGEATALAAARSALEAAVGKRPYFHVKPLDAASLQVRAAWAPVTARAQGSREG